MKTFTPKDDSRCPICGGKHPVGTYICDFSLPECPQQYSEYTFIKVEIPYCKRCEKNHINPKERKWEYPVIFSISAVVFIVSFILFMIDYSNQFTSIFRVLFSVFLSGIFSLLIAAAAFFESLALIRLLFKDFSASKDVKSFLNQEFDPTNNLYKAGYVLPGDKTWVKFDINKIKDALNQIVNKCGYMEKVVSNKTTPIEYTPTVNTNPIPTKHELPNQTLVSFPIDNDGDIDFQAITDASVFRLALLQYEKEEELNPNEILDEYKQLANEELQHSKLIKDPLKRMKAVKRVSDRIEMLNSINI